MSGRAQELRKEIVPQLGASRTQTDTALMGASGSSGVSMSVAWREIATSSFGCQLRWRCLDCASGPTCFGAKRLPCHATPLMLCFVRQRRDSARKDILARPGGDSVTHSFLSQIKCWCIAISVRSPETRAGFPSQSVDRYLTESRACETDGSVAAPACFNRQDEG
jgi:hypothetical protein